MNIDSTNFRDKALAQVTIGYDWAQSLNYALVSVQDRDGAVSTYRLVGLTEYSINEDFGCMAISQCKFIDDSSGIYLSLDPYNELGAREEEDNFCFWCKSIERANGQC
ncbi:hypothetical protein BCU91_18715 [Shewanella sp. 10N.286.52.B9]|nr:hypothetical protein BCU91_18715 [Shewanella sp. 10N.286.52.B9]